MRMHDRQAAGRLLAPAVGRQDLDDPVVIGIGAGGLAVAAEVARALHCPLDMLEVVELDAGDALHPARAFGALAGDGHVLVRPASLENLASGTSLLRDALRRARSGADNASTNHRWRSRAVPTSWRSVVLVDDGSSSRDVLTAAVDLVRAGRPGRVLVAMPIAPQELIDELSPLTGEVIVATVPPWVEWFRWHGRIYEDDQVPTGAQLAQILAG